MPPENVWSRFLATTSSWCAEHRRSNYRPQGSMGAHLDTVLKEEIWFSMKRRLESRLNPQAGKPAPRSAHFRVCGFWGLSSPQFENSVKTRALERTAEEKRRKIYIFSTYFAASSLTVCASVFAASRSCWKTGLD